MIKYQLKVISDLFSDFSLVSGSNISLFDSFSKDFYSDDDCMFCKSCNYNISSKCSYLNVHRYGFFEAERWNGLYIYYCPLGLTFTATTIAQNHETMLAVISGPVIMSTYREFLDEFDDEIIEEIKNLPFKLPAEVSSAAKIQKHLSDYLSDNLLKKESLDNGSKIDNVMYDIVSDLERNKEAMHFFEIEKQLQNMIINGDKKGAQELINELLGQVYFSTDGDFSITKLRMYDLVILMSRAAISGGADIGTILGQNHDVMDTINKFTSVHELSDYISVIFNRFVGYVFDFGTAHNSDVMHKTINYIRTNYSSRITLQEVADHVYLSKSYFSKLFKEETNMSFTEYINNIRVNKSKELLRNSSLIIAEIASIVGFSDQSYFNKVFIKQEGITPGEYRKSKTKY